MKRWYWTEYGMSETVYERIAWTPHTEAEEAVARAVEQERREILRWLSSELDKEGPSSNTFYMHCMAYVRSRGTPAPACTCGNRATLVGSHWSDCPCYEKPKPVCTCNALTRAWPVADHLPGCACYVAPQTPPLEKVGRLFAPDDNENILCDAVNALVDAVNELRGVK